MRSIVIIITFLLGNTCVFGQAYEVFSLKNDTNLSKDSIRIVGRVYEDRVIPVVGALVSEVFSSAETYTDSFGAFSITVARGDSGIFVYKEGFSEVFLSNNMTAGFNTAKVNFYLTRQIIFIEKPEPPIDPQIMSYKPVIYAYSQKSIQARFELAYKGKLTFTYPEMGEGWEASIDSSGLTVEGRSYPYLFWEGELDHLHFVSSSQGELEGELVARDQLVTTLEVQLTEMGLNTTERTDFITFWVPRMLPYEYCFVQFLQDEAYGTEIAGLDITPKPDAIKRIYMLFQGFDFKPSFSHSPQQLKSFERKGFTVVEWGGSQIDKDVF